MDLNANPSTPLDVLAERIDALDRLIHAELEAIAKATETQSAELARRLLDLNHAHERAQEDKAAFATKADQKALTDRFEEFKDEVKSEMIPGLREEVRLAAANAAGEETGLSRAEARSIQFRSWMIAAAGVFVAAVAIVIGAFT